MSDESSLATATAGSLSPRNTDTVVYKVQKALPRTLFAIGATFSAWAQGEKWAHVSRHGLGIVTNREIEEWEKAGLIVRETPLTPAQERARNADLRSAATSIPEAAISPSGDVPARPWSYPEGSPDPSEPVR